MADGMSYDEWKRRARARSGHPTTRKKQATPRIGERLSELGTRPTPGTSRQEGKRVQVEPAKGNYTRREELSRKTPAQNARAASQIEDRRKPQGVPSAVKYSGASAAHPKQRRVAASKPSAPVLARRSAKAKQMGGK